MGDTNGGKFSERYELNELFPEESPGVLQFLKIAGGVVVVGLILLALAYPFFVD